MVFAPILGTVDGDVRPVIIAEADRVQDACNPLILRRDLSTNMIVPEAGRLDDCIQHSRERLLADGLEQRGRPRDAHVLAVIVVVGADLVVFERLSVPLVLVDDHETRLPLVRQIVKVLQDFAVDVLDPSLQDMLVAFRPSKLLLGGLGVAARDLLNAEVRLTVLVKCDQIVVGVRDRLGLTL